MPAPSAFHPAWGQRHLIPVLDELAVFDPNGFERERLIGSRLIVRIGQRAFVDGSDEIAFGHDDDRIAQLDPAQLYEANPSLLSFFERGDPRVTPLGSGDFVQPQSARVVLDVIFGLKAPRPLLTRTLGREEVEKKLLIRLELRLGWSGWCLRLS